MYRARRRSGLVSAAFAAALILMSGIALAAGGSWTPTSVSGAPPGREAHTAIWTGTTMVVWGGDAGHFDSLNSGGIFDPVANSWKAMSKTGAPAPRDLASAIWTGSKMIIWGGYFWNGTGNSATNVFNNGALYDPDTDTWTAMAQANAPSARADHTAIWTGSKMIIWGGDASPISPQPYNFHSVNTGAIYDPVADLWTPMSTANAPSPRAVQAAVWTGSKMIVWGGGSPTDQGLNSGAIYDPEIDVWSPMSTAGAPVGREFFTYVWTGSELIVWGGVPSGSSSPINSGGVYDPETNSWTATSTNGAPLARADQVAAWTGGQMIVWGGFGSNFIGSGALYDPDANSWTSMSSAGAPSARELATAVWTGSGMIVWAGYDGTNDVNTGGIFSPPCPPDGARNCVSPISSGTDRRSTGRDH